MSERKIGELPEHPGWKKEKGPPPCPSRGHAPASHIVREPGIYEHTCDDCGEVTRFVVPAVTSR